MLGKSDTFWFCSVTDFFWATRAELRLHLINQSQTSSWHHHFTFLHTDVVLSMNYYAQCRSDVLQPSFWLAVDWRWIWSSSCYLGRLEAQLQLVDSDWIELLLGKESDQNSKGWSWICSRFSHQWVVEPKPQGAELDLIQLLLPGWSWYKTPGGGGGDGPDPAAPI